MCPKAENCSKCGREITGEEQAYVFEGEIVCKHCNTKLRNPKPWWRTFQMVLPLFFVVICVCVLSWFLWTRFSPSPSTPKFIVQMQKTALGSVGPKDEVLLSPDGRRIAICRSIQGWASVVNEEGRRELIRNPSEDRKTPVLIVDNVEIGGTGGTHLYQTDFKFSPDSQRFMCEIRRGRAAYVIVDGTKGKEYLAVRELTFSPDSRHFAYCARMVDSGSESWTVVTDGIEGPTYKKVGDLTFSSDGTKLAYRILNDQGIAAMVLNGEYGEFYKSVSSPAFFLNTGDLVYIGMHFNGETMVVVVGETEGHPYEVIATDSLRLDPTGTRFAYAAFRGDKLLMVTDGKESPEYDEITHPSFSNDGQRLAYIAKRNDRYVIVVDGVESKEYDEVRSGLFSPDSSRYCFVARRENKWLTVVDGIEGQEFDNVRHMIFSPDSERVAYVAGRNEKDFVVVDGIEGEECDGVIYMTFSPDSKRFVYEMNLGFQSLAIPLTEDEQRTIRTWVPDGTGMKLQEIKLPNAKGDERLHRALGRWHYVLDGVHGKEYESVFCPTFGPDSKHFVYLASDDDRVMIIVDDVCVFEGEGISFGNLSYTRKKDYSRVTPKHLRNRLIFDSPTTFHTFAKYEGEVVRFDFTILDTKK